MREVDELVKDLLGNNPLLGSQALGELEHVGVSALPEIFKAALQIEDRTTHGVNRLAKLFAHWGAEAGQFLVGQIETDKWEGQRLAAQCFRYLRDSDLAASIAERALHSTTFDVQRHAIAALGEMGADGWSREIIEVTLGPDDPLRVPNSYTVGKLGSYAAEALVKMVVREADESFVETDLFMLDQFLTRIWNKGKIKELYGPGESGIKEMILRGLHEISPIAATPLQKQWLHGTWSLEQSIAAEALYRLPLDRVATDLGNCILDSGMEASVRYACAISLMSFSTAHASRCLKPALPHYFEADPTVARGILLAYSGLFFYDAPAQWNDSMIAAMLQTGGESKAQLIYGLGLWRKRAELIDEGLVDSDGFIREVAALALARSRGEGAIPKLRAMRRDAATANERLFITTALVYAGGESRVELFEELCKLPTAWREVRLLRYIWKREILSALNSDSPPWAPEATAWAEAMEVDLQRCMEEIQEIAKLLEPAANTSMRGKRLQEAQIMATATAEKHGPAIFVSYSHEDEKWLKKLELVLSPLTKGQTLDLWTDKKIDAGAKWKEEIQKALERADLAILLVTQPFLASEFIAKHELPRLLKRAEERGLRILWIPVSASLYASTEIALYQAVIDPKKPLDTFKGARLNGKLVEIANAIAGAAERIKTSPAS